MNEGVILWGQKTSQAEKLFQEAERLLLSIPPDHRNEGGNAVITLGQINLNWGGMLQTLTRSNEAIARSDAGLKQVEPYLRIEPNDVVAQEVCFKLHGNRGLALSGLGRHRESADDWVRVVELSTQPVPTEYRLRLAIELVYAGELVRALAQAQLVKPSPDISGEDCYNLACIYSRSAANAQNEKSGSLDQQARLIESHVLDALRWLRSAAKAGLFKDPAQRDQAKKDPDLEILRNRKEFRQFIESTSAKS